ncbi:helix-turn-helix domain-containing protein [Leptobacterium flavescens]|uniref:Helix-turn-helix domain-containing protein n=1 Tax=Leptobacterium flavescens TaxID=472055 RepID=A0A6P0UVJ0_9FLAO|nr:helix-turn-helix domain-containing protein [Leptobacterium flavescens]NER14426.1 helix-turn-helix domain-containing protein [Leptobacterium flavescens]
MNSIESFSFIVTFFLGGIILIGIFILSVVLRSSGLGFSRYFLAFIIFGLIQHLFTYLLFTTELIKQWPHLFGLGYPLLFLVGPAFYFFVRSYGDSSFRFKPVYLIHILPFLIMFVFYLPLHFQGIEEKQKLIDYYYNILPQGGVSFTDWFLASLYMLLLFAYAVGSFVYLHRKDKKNSILLKRISLLLILLAFLDLLLQTGFLLSGASAITSEIVLSGVLSISILLLGYWIVDIKQVLPLGDKNKYRTSPLSDEQSRQIQKRIRNAIEGEELYLNPNLKIGDLAKAIETPSHHISQVLNHSMQAGFYDIINKYRVDRARELLCSATLEKLSIQAIGEECGFNNKASFYRAFKKHTQMTPSEYISKKHGN